MTQDERELWEEYRVTGSLALRDELFARYEALCVSLAWKYKPALNTSTELVDIKQYAYIGLLDAIAKFDVTQGFAFITYATKRIAGAIQDAYRGSEGLVFGMRVSRVDSLRRGVLSAKEVRIDSTPSYSDSLACERKSMENEVIDNDLINTLYQSFESLGCPGEVLSVILKETTAKEASAKLGMPQTRVYSMCDSVRKRKLAVAMRARGYRSCYA
jgi:RNA polymerase sigma factor (sigma-70 family)